MPKNNILNRRSCDIPAAEKKNLIAQAKEIMEISPSLLSYAGIPLHGDGKICIPPAGKKREMRLSSFEITGELCQDAAIRFPNELVGVFVACSHKNPGGGWMSGAVAQEESISRQSTWAIQAKEHQCWYNTSKDWLGQNGGLVLNGLSLWGNNIKETVFAGVSAANKNACSKKEWITHRNERILSLADAIDGSLREMKKRGCTTAILCAFGTGVFGWEQKDAAEAIQIGVSNSGTSMNFVIAVGTTASANNFKQYFPNTKPDISNGYV